MTNVKFTGILSANISDEVAAQIEKIQSLLPKDAICLKRKDLHITLINQKILKPFKKYMQNFTFLNAPVPIFKDDVIDVNRKDKKSWIVMIENQCDYLRYISSIRMSLLNEGVILPDEDRVFHISIANLIGNPFASVGDVSWKDVERDLNVKTIK